MKYERLTGSGLFYTDGDVMDRLVELEDKIENGTLVELPCKVGDKVYPTSYGLYKVYYVSEISFRMDESETFIEFEILSFDHCALDYFELDDIGKTIFFDENERDEVLNKYIEREETEAKLRELKNKKGDI